MKKVTISSVMMLFVGIISGALLLTNFDSNLVGTLFAKENAKLGAKNSPVQMSDGMRIINESVIKVSDAVLPVVVSIKVESEMKGNGMMGGSDPRMEEFFRFFMPDEDSRGGRGEDDEKSEKSEKPRAQGSGSGVIISGDGYIITNNHVIENAVEDGIQVILNDKKEYTAKLVGSDPLTDLAVLKIEANNLPMAHFADINSAKVGEMVIAVGSPLGLNSTVTSGIISAIGRGKLGLNSNSYSVENYIQTDAAINPGNSGGGLFDMNGSLIGINTAIASSTGSYIGYGFAIPTDLVQSVVQDLIEDGKINRGYIGVQITSIRDEVEAKAFGLDKVTGVLINDVLKESAAEKAGVLKGDIILEVNGKEVSSSQELQSQVALQRAGDKVKLTLFRDGKKINKDVILKAKDDDDELANTGSKKDMDKGDKESNEPINFEDLGFSVKALESKNKKDFDVENGVLVSDVKRYSAASKRNLFPNGIITKADKKEINSTEDLKKIIDGKKPGDVLLMQVKYKENSQYIALEIPKKEG